MTTTSALRFRRIRRSDGLVETLTIVRLPEDLYCEYLERATPFGVQVEHGERFVGVFGLDGERVANWLLERGFDVAVPVPADVVEAVEQGWESGNYTVERIEK